MKIKSTPPAVLVAIFLFNLVNSVDLFRSWSDTPVEEVSLFFFLIWLLPLPIHWCENPEEEFVLSRENGMLAFLSLLMALLGMVSSLNAFAYWGLAFSVAACLPWSMTHLWWIVSSIAWMPASGWLLLRQFPESSPLVAQLLRLALVTAGVLSLLLLKKHSREKTNG